MLVLHFISILFYFIQNEIIYIYIYFIVCLCMKSEASHRRAHIEALNRGRVAWQSQGQRK